MTRRCARIVAFAAALAFPAAGAFADEEEDTQAPAVSPTPMTAFGAAGSDVSGARAIARDILDEPDGVRATARWFIPVSGKAWTGGHAADLSSSREGWLRAWTRSTDGKSIELLARADRRPLAFRTRVPFAASTLEEAGTHRESARFLFSAPIPSHDGRVQVFAEWRGGGGVRPSTSAAYASGDVGPAFRAPAWRRGDHGATSAGASIGVGLAGVRVVLDGRAADETLNTSFRAPDRLTPSGGLVLDRDERRRVGEAGLSVDAPMGALLAGGSYRVRAVQAEGGGERRQDPPDALQGETSLDDVDIRSLTHRGSFGVAFLPLPSVRMGFTATAVSQRLRSDSVERRDLADDSVSAGEASLDLWSTSVGADAVWFARALLSVDARAVAETARYDDAWTQTLLAPGGSGGVPTRGQAITRDRSYTKLETSVTAGPWRRVRATAGVSSEHESFDLASGRAIDSPLLDDGARDRTTLFLWLRARPAAGLMLDGRAKAFDEVRDLGGTEPARRRSELRGRATYTRGGVSVFGVGALTEDRYELATLPSGVEGFGYLPIEFGGRSWICSSGFAVPVQKTWRASATVTRVVQAGDLDARLLDIAADVGGPLNDRLRLSAGVHHLDWQDERSPWHDAGAFVGFVRLSGSL